MKAVFTVAALALLAGCVSTPHRLADSADRLDRSADDLYEELRRDSDDSDASREARQLAEAADEFNDDLDDSHDVDREDLRESFEVVAKSYHDLRDELDENDVDADERSAFADVTSAYLDLERELEYRHVSDL